MSIYTDEQITNNKLYGGIMSDINSLYLELGQPAEFDDDETRTSTTTGNHQDSYWSGRDLGDWGADLDDVVEYANNTLETVIDGLSLYGNGGISHFFTSDKWDEFVKQAEALINEYHNDGAFEQLCVIFAD